MTDLAKKYGIENAHTKYGIGEREIKFRCWCKRDKGFLHCFSMTPDKGVEARGGVQMYPERNWVVTQYTGLKDKNGVEIWENDLVELDNNRLCKVVWHSYSGRWDLKFISEKQLTPKFLPCGINDIRNRGEVIGNIHENPELLN